MFFPYALNLTNHQQKSKIHETGENYSRIDQNPIFQQFKKFSTTTFFPYVLNLTNHQQKSKTQTDENDQRIVQNLIFQQFESAFKS